MGYDAERIKTELRAKIGDSNQQSVDTAVKYLADASLPLLACTLRALLDIQLRMQQLRGVGAETYAGLAHEVGRSKDEIMHATRVLRVAGIIHAEHFTLARFQHYCEKVHGFAVKPASVKVARSGFFVYEIQYDHRVFGKPTAADLEAIRGFSKCEHLQTSHLPTPSTKDWYLGDLTPEEIALYTGPAQPVPTVSPATSDRPWIGTPEEKAAILWLIGSNQTKAIPRSLKQQAKKWLIGERDSSSGKPLCDATMAETVRMHREVMARVEKHLDRKIRITPEQKQLLVALAGVGVEITPLELLVLTKNPDYAKLQPVRKLMESALKYLGIPSPIPAS
jgi:hypothetical protein